MKVRNRNQAGFTLVEIGIVVAIIGLLATIATPTWVRARSTSQMNTCINNLKQIDGAKQQWALENKGGPTSTPTYDNISGYLKNAVYCPSDASATFGTSYEMHSVAEKPTCKIDTTHFLPDVTN